MEWLLADDCHVVQVAQATAVCGRQHSRTVLPVALVFEDVRNRLTAVLVQRVDGVLVAPVVE